MFRRPIRRPLRGVQAGHVPPALQRANRLMASGQYDEAAAIFEQFANGALVRRGPRAPWFLLQAGQARLQAGQVQAGVAHLQQGLGLLAQERAVPATVPGREPFSCRTQRSRPDCRGRADRNVTQNQPAGWISPGAGEGTERSRPLLPTNCPSCGGSLRSDEVEWADEMTAECPYCGSAVRAEK